MIEDLSKYQENLNQFTGCIKPYSLMDVYGLFKLISKYKLRKAQPLEICELESILTVFKGRNVFEIV